MIIYLLDSLTCIKILESCKNHNYAHTNAEGDSNHHAGYIGYLVTFECLVVSTIMHLLHDVRIMIIFVGRCLATKGFIGKLPAAEWM